MSRWMTVTVTIAAMAGCGTDAGGQGGQALQQALERVLVSAAEGRGEVACEVLRSGVLVEVFGTAAGAATFEPGARYVPQALCSAFWDKPNREELEAALAEYESRRVMAVLQGRTFDEPAPPLPRYEVGLTIINRRYDSPAAAVTALEESVTGLTQSGTRDAAGTQVRVFEGFVEGVGDRAGWAPRVSELSVVHAGVRYAVMVRGLANGAAENREKAIEVARWLAGG